MALMARTAASRSALIPPMVFPLSNPSHLLRITKDGLVGRVNVGEGRVTFEQGPPDADPVSQFQVTLNPLGHPVRVTGPLQPGSVPASNITPGRTMLAWFDGQGTVVAAASSPRRALSLTSMPDVQLRLDWNDDTLLWGETVTDAAGLHNTLHVSRFGPT